MTSDHDDLRRAALEYHEKPTPGKISIAPTKQLVNQRDLALAYSPGVAAASEAIHADPATASRYTARANLVGVVTNGTAVLGLGNIGPLAAKPVMEGKAVLFKKFAGIDVFDIEINENDPDKLIEIIASLEPTFGGINLEDIKAPECFYVERKLRERMKIPVFHDDQHGTAIIVGAAVQNGLNVLGKDLKKVKLVTSGAGAAALACLKLLVELGLPREHIWVTDIEGVVYEGRTVLMDEDKARFAQPTSARTLAEVIRDADIFLGLSAGGVLKPEMVKTMAPHPLILALANPTPEILPEEVKAVRDDAVIATGRSRLSEPGQQRAVLPVHLPRRARRRRDDDHDGDGDRRRARGRGTGAGGAERCGGVGLRHHQPPVRPRVPDPEAVRPAADHAHRAGRGRGSDGERRGDAPDRRHGRLPRPVAAVRLSLRHVHEADLRDGEERGRLRRQVTHRVRRGRGRAGAAGRAGRPRREDRHADPDRTAGGDRQAARALRPAHAAGRRLRADQSRVRPALSRLRGDVSPAGRAQGHHRAVRKARDAPPADADRRDDDPQGRCRRHDLRHLRHARAAPGLHRPGDRPAARGRRVRRDEHRDAAGPAARAGRHAREPRSDRGAAGRDHDHGRRADEAPRHLARRSPCCRTPTSDRATARPR